MKEIERRPSTFRNIFLRKVLVDKRQKQFKQMSRGIVVIITTLKFKGFEYAYFKNKSNSTNL
jgi:hypothetical protein